MAEAFDEGVWQRLDVTPWARSSAEVRGTSEAVWLLDPDDNEWLHKSTKVHEDGGEQGEDWAELLGFLTGACLGVPCAKVRLCLRSGRRGSLSSSLNHVKYAFTDGCLHLEEMEAPGYFRHQEGDPGCDPQRPEIRRPGHHLRNIRDSLGGIDPPPGAASSLTAWDVFTGYLILDALIANRDRHEENWAVRRAQLSSTVSQLAASYDHARAFGSGLREDQRETLTADPAALQRFCAKGTAHRFEHRKGEPIPTLVEVAAAAVEMGTPTGADHWRKRLNTLDLAPMLEPVREGAIPEMSVHARTFTEKLVETNLRRLRHAICGASA
ncbi:hypothetical protein [Aeromicrobium piscarium]|uniref:HipA-like C-terminal domain-containing protein n=1 Tax=Aeromicrobium piscarium TaxID=2590901 RepID=A0A554RX44_9ACTN|nr:hypothetical protein [Aeromicrobium piscarium]TSD58678.1 hypothetical protein FNM00_13545 [Aeromicrobium piscarium]